jgi:hypothetical protein
MENAIKYANFIKRIFSAPPKIRKKLLATSNLDIIKAITEIILNIYHLNLPVSKSALKQLKKSKTVILKIINKKTLPAKRKELLIKHSEVFVPIAKVLK